LLITVFLLVLLAGYPAMLNRLILLLNLQPQQQPQIRMSQQIHQIIMQIIPRQHLIPIRQPNSTTTNTNTNTNTNAGTTNQNNQDDDFSIGGENLSKIS